MYYTTVALFDVVNARSGPRSVRVWCEFDAGKREREGQPSFFCVTVLLSGYLGGELAGGQRRATSHGVERRG